MSLYNWLAKSIRRLSRHSDIAEVATHSIYLRPLAPGSLVIDLGANVGSFARAMSELGFKCHAVEAMPEFCSQIPADGGIQTHNVAIAERPGTLNLYVSANRECNSVFSDIAELYGVRDHIECPATTLEVFLRDHGIGKIDLLKVDIEGAEEQLFRSSSDATLSQIGQITVEFHDFIPNGIAPEEVRRIRKRLRRLGFVCLPFSYMTPLQDTCDVLFVNRHFNRVPLGDRLRFAVIRALLEVQHLKARLRGPSALKAPTPK